MRVPINISLIFFPEIPGNSDWQKVKVEHLLNMITGMDWTDVRDLEELENHLNDPLPYIFSKSIIYTPGTTYQYNTTSSHLLSYILQRTSGITPGEFAQSIIWGPLDVNGYNWDIDGNGIERGGAGLELTARDLEKLDYYSSKMDDGMMHNLSPGILLEKPGKNRFTLRTMRLQVSAETTGGLEK